MLVVLHHLVFALLNESRRRPFATGADGCCSGDGFDRSPNGRPGGGRQSRPAPARHPFQVASDHRPRAEARGPFCCFAVSEFSRGGGELAARPSSSAMAAATYGAETPNTRAASWIVALIWTKPRTHSGGRTRALACRPILGKQAPSVNDGADWHHRRCMTYLS